MRVGEKINKTALQKGKGVGMQIKKKKKRIFIKKTQRNIDSRCLRLHEKCSPGGTAKNTRSIEHKHRKKFKKIKKKKYFPSLKFRSVATPHGNILRYTIFGCIFLNRKLDSMSNTPKKGGGREREKEMILKTHKLLFSFSFPC